MGWSGSTFTRTDGTRSGDEVWQDAAAANVKILAADHDTHDEDLANGIEACLKKDGGNSPTSNIDWGAFKITNLGAPSAATDAATFGYTVTGLSLSTKTLTATRATPADLTVDLTAVMDGAATGASFDSGTQVLTLELQNATDATVSLASLGSDRAAWQVQTSAYNILAGDAVVANTFSGAFTITLPLTVSAGDQFTIACHDALDTSLVTLARNGHSFNWRNTVTADDLTIAPGEVVTFVALTGGPNSSLLILDAQ